MTEAAQIIMRFRKMLDRLGIHGYYAEMQKEFEAELEGGQDREDRKPNED
jgi:hypothetical protein